MIIGTENSNAMTEEEKKKQQPDAVEQAIQRMESRASELNDYAGSPVRIDTSNQPNWMNEIERVRREYMESPEQKAARERRETRNRRIAAITDGLIGLSNVAGAMAGATPVRQTSLSAAHRQAVEDAARRRKNNAQLYDTAQRYYSGLQYKQNKDNADRYDKEIESRRNAGKEAGSLLNNAARLRQARENSQRNYDLAQQRLEEQKRHNATSEGLQAERNSISRSKGSSGGGSGKNSELENAYAYWESLTPQQKQQYRDWNGRKNSQIVGSRVVKGPDGKDTTELVYGNTPDDKAFILHVWEQRQGWLRNKSKNKVHSSGTVLRNRNGGGSALRNRN